MPSLGRNTYQEILSQPTIWGQTLANLRRMDVSRIPRGDEFDQTIFIGCGSTYYLSIWAARAIQARNGWRCRPLPASEMWLNPDHWLNGGRSTLTVAVSRSGTTSETVAALRGFNDRQRGRSVVVTCYPESELARMTDSTIALPLAQEKSVAQTRSFSNMMLGLGFFAHSDIDEDIPDALSSQAVRLFERRTDLVSGLGKDKGIQRFFFLGSGALYGLACEAMLKMKEMSLSYAEAYHFLEFRHGPMSMVDSSSLVIGLLGTQNTQHELKVLEDMKALGARVLAIGDLEEAKVMPWLDHFIPLNLNGLGMFGDVLYLLPLQMLAFERALVNGNDPDHPKNLTAVVMLDG